MTDALRDDLDNFVAPPEEFPPPPLDPLDETQANGMLRRLRKLSRERHNVTTVAKAETDQIAAWERERLGSLDRRMEELTRTLEAWMRMHSQRTNTVTKKLPNGELRLRPARASTEITDDVKVITWCYERVVEQLVEAATEVMAAADVERLPASITAEEARQWFFVVLSRLQSEPFLRVKIEVAKGVIGQRCEEGPVTSKDGVLELHAAVDTATGSALPGVQIQRPMPKTFGMTLATADEPYEPEPDEDEEVNRG